MIRAYERHHSHVWEKCFLSLSTGFPGCHSHRGSSTMSGACPVSVLGRRWLSKCFLCLRQKHSSFIFSTAHHVSRCSPVNRCMHYSHLPKEAKGFFRLSIHPISSYTIRVLGMVYRVWFKVLVYWKTWSHNLPLISFLGRSCSKFTYLKTRIR